MRNFQREWVFPELFDVPPDFEASVGGSFVVSQALFRRGISSLDAANGFLDPDLYQPSPPSSLPGLETAVDLIEEVLTAKKNILIWGDFDVDGQTSTTLLVSGLRGLGSKIDHYIPNRATESHGITPHVLKEQISKYDPAILITCDTGIDEIESISISNSAGVDVIITDHHQLPPTLPAAHSIVNPSMLTEDHPLYNLPGVGVAYKLIESLYTRLDKDPTYLLDLVALGIVADVARQTLDTRYLLQKGLTTLRTSPRLGIQELCKIARISQDQITEEQIGFVIGPRLNALGRLSDANTCVEFFTTDDLHRAKELATLLDQLNVKRQDLTETIYKDSLKKIEKSPDLVEDYPVIVLQGPRRWDPGVIGIVASRIVEHFHKPVIMLSEEGDIARGSARSIPGVPISSLISESSSLLKSYGGHPMAAGVSLDLGNVSQFRYNLKENFQRVVGAPPAPSKVVIDADIPFKSISPSFVKDFLRLAPFGAGNPKLLFSTRSVHFDPNDIKVIGKNENHKKITLIDSAGTAQDLLWWNSADINLPSGSIDVAYSLDLSLYKNRLQAQATLRHFRESSGSPVILKGKTKIKLLDYRATPSPEKLLADLVPIGESLIWSELIPVPGFESFSRSELSPTDTLIIWTIPPNSNVLKYALKISDPKNIFFFAIDPNMRSLKKVVTTLLSLCIQFHDSGRNDYDPIQFAQRIAVTPAIIEVGLDWIHAHGEYDLSSFVTEGKVLPGPGKNLETFPTIDMKLKFMIKEMAAYRHYYSKAKLETLL